MYVKMYIQWAVPTINACKHVYPVSISSINVCKHVYPVSSAYY